MSITEQGRSATDSSDPLGSRLVRARLAHGLSIEDVCERTNIRPGVVRALERGDIEPSGGSVYARGHLRSLANVLGIEPEQLLADFDGVHSGAQPDRVLRLDPASTPAPAHRAAARTPKAARSGPSRWPIVAAVILVAVIVAASVALLLPDNAPKRSSTTPTAPRVSAPVKKKVVPPATPPLTFPVPAQGVTLRIILPSQASWLDVTDQSGASLVHGVVQPSTHAVDLHATGQLRATIGNAAAAAVSCNGHPLGPLGGPGQVVFLVLTRGDPQCPAG